MSTQEPIDFDDLFDASALDKLPSKKRESNINDLEEKASKKAKNEDNDDNILFKLQLKRNQAREKLKISTEDEYKRISAGPTYYAGKDYRERKEKADKFEEDLKERGVDPERYKLLHETQEKLEAQEKKNKKGTDSHDCM